MSSIASFSSLIAAAMRVEADRAAAELVDDRPQQLAIDLVEAVLVDLEQLQRGVRDLERDGARRRAPARSRARGAAAGWRCAACRATAARSRRPRRRRSARRESAPTGGRSPRGRRPCRTRAGATMPKRDRSGDVSSPVRVVAPMSVNALKRHLDRSARSAPGRSRCRARSPRAPDTGSPRSPATSGGSRR